MNMLALAASASGAVSIVAFHTGPWMLAAVTKALTTILIIAFAAGRDRSSAYGRAILAGLVASLAGDVFLLWPDKGFMPGLLSFLVAHLAYLYAFTDRLKHGLASMPAIAYAAVAGLALFVLWGSVPGDLRAPVAVYVAALVGMAAMAASRALRAAPENASFARIAAVGGALFVTSDTMLAFNKFMGPIPLAQAFVLTTYWLAQWAIASSVRPAR